MKISACLITKNEEKNIERCINSFKNIVQEIILVDTGSNDNTITLAKNLGAEIFNYEWGSSFADARNFAIDKANGDWIIFLDADEYFYGNTANLIPELIRHLKDKDGILLKFKDFDEDSGKQIQEATLLRIFKNKPYIKYKGNIHETVFNSLKKMRLGNLGDCGIEIHHTGYSTNKINQKGERNLRLLLKELENYNDDKMIFFYLSDCYQILGNYKESMYYAKKFIQSGTVAIGYRTKPYNNIIKSMIKLKINSKEIENTLLEYISIFPTHPDFYRYLGVFYLEQRKYKRALENLMKTIELNETYNDIEMNITSSCIDEIFLLIGKILEMKNENSNAIEYYIKSLKVNKYNKVVFDLLINIIKNENAEDIILLLLKIYNKNDKNNVQFLVGNLKRLKLGKVLLYFGNLWINNYKQDDSTFMFMLLSIGNYKDAYNLFKKCFELEKDDWVLDHYVLLMFLTVDLNELEKISNSNNPYANVAYLYLNKKKKVYFNNIELECYLKLIEQSIFIKEEKLYNHLINLSEFINNNLSNELTKLLMNHKKYTEAVNYLDKELNLGKLGFSDEVCFNIGYCYYKLNNYSKALYFFNLAISKGYKQQDVYEIFEWIRSKGVDLSKSINLPNDEIENNLNSKELNQLFHTNLKVRIQNFIQEGQISKAKELIQQHETAMFDDPEFFSIKAVIAITEENLDEAKQILLMGLEIDSENTDLLYNLAFVYREKKEYLETLNCFKRALKSTNSNELIALIHQEIETTKEQLNGLHDYTYQPLVSIIVLAYNNLEYTKLCVDSILKYTAHINYELITVNNGSSDGTQEYFDSLPNAKVIQLEDNVGPVNGFNEGIKEAKGKYTACVCNDFIFTHRWLDNLLECIESDETIGFVSPGSSNVSNYQSIEGSYKNIREMLNFAKEYNYSNPKKWEERVRLLPCVLLVRTFLLKKLEGYDPRFYYGEFADDDISFRIRRSGYKLIYCKDTFTYHFGSVTTRDDQINNNSLNASRKIFFDKHGLDPWTDASFNPDMIRVLSNTSSVKEARILGINTKCGGNPLQLKNYLREKGLERISITNYCLDKKYRADLETVSNYVVDGLLHNLQEQLINQKYNYIILEHHGGVFDQYSTLMDQIGELLDEGGHIAFSLQTTEVDESMMKKTSTFLINQGYHVTYQQFMHNNSNDFDLIIIGKRSV